VRGAPFGGRYAPRANAEKPCFLFSEQGSLSAKTGRISANSWEFTPRNRDRNRPCLGRPQGRCPPTVRRCRDLCVHSSSGVARTIAVRPERRKVSESKLDRLDRFRAKAEVSVSWRRSAWRKQRSLPDGSANGSNGWTPHRSAWSVTHSSQRRHPPCAVCAKVARIGEGND